MPWFETGFIQIFALQEDFFKAWFANVVPMAATIYIDDIYIYSRRISENS